MYIEDKYIQEQFSKNFLEGTSENIIIYGTGVYTKKLLENIHTERIVGLMDIARTGEILFGKKVLSYEEVAQIPNVSIVIMARNAVINVIYRRIKPFVQKYKIPVYDINGNNLNIMEVFNQDHECFQLKKEDLLNKIEKVDVVSFDIFDTLLVRNVFRPRDVFKLIDGYLGNEDFVFSVERIKAEEELQMDRNQRNPDIYQIYRKIQKNLGLSDEKCKKMLELELDIEEKVLSKRESICLLLDNLVSKGKKVFLISDMYLPKNILKNILDTFGIRGYEDIYISCEYKKLKEEGLFRDFLIKLGISASRCLHIGDNYIADILSAEKEGINTFQIYSVMEMFENSIYAGILEKCQTIEQKVILANFAKQAYNDPFGEYYSNGKLILRKDVDIINLFIAPIIFKYCLWLAKNVHNNKQDYVIFPSRDGYLLKKIYDLLKEKYTEYVLPESVYLYTSRRMALAASVMTAEDIKNIIEFSDTRSLKESIKARFELDINDNDTIWNKERLIEKIKDRCNYERDNYLKYIKEKGLYEHESIAFVDFVASGTVQKALQKLTGIPMTGYYFLKRLVENEEKEFQCFSLYQKCGDFQMTSNIYRFYYFFEILITSYEPTVKYVDKDGKFCFYDENRDEQTLELIKKVHEIILEYCEKLLSIISNIQTWDCQVEFYDILLGFFSEEYSDIKDSSLIGLKNIDEFMGRVVTDMNR